MARRLTLLPVLLVCLTVAACGSSSSSGNSSSSAGSHGTIGVSLPEVQGSYFTAEQYGIISAATKLGYKADILNAGSYSNLDQQLSQVGNLLLQHASALLVEPADPSIAPTIVARAHSSHTPVVDLAGSDPHADANVASNYCTLGKEMAVGAKKLLPHGGTLGVLAGPPGASWATIRLGCFKHAIAGSGIHIVAEQTSDPTVEAGLTVASDMLQRFPNINLLYGADDTVGDGAAKAVQAAHKCGKTKVLIAVLGTQAEQLMRQGCIQFDVAQQVVLIGRDAVDAAVRLAKHETLTQRTIDVPLVLVTPQNIKRVNLAAIREPRGWRPPAG